jgi:hypothetical protein
VQKRVLHNPIRAHLGLNLSIAETTSATLIGFFLQEKRENEGKVVRLTQFTREQCNHGLTLHNSRRVHESAKRTYIFLAFPRYGVVSSPSPAFFADGNRNGSVCGFCGFLAMFGETFSAVNRFASSRLEGDGTFFSATCAFSVKHCSLCHYFTSISLKVIEKTNFQLSPSGKARGKHKGCHSKKENFQELLKVAQAQEKGV